MRHSRGLLTRPGALTGDRAARRGRVVFALTGTATGTFASRLPWIAVRLHLYRGLLELVGPTMSVGALVAMPPAAWFVHRFGPAAATGALIVGALIGMADNAMNAQAVTAGQRAGRPMAAPGS